MSDDVPGTPGGVRLQLFMARCGIGSRRHCEEMIAAGEVSVNGKRVTRLGSRVVAGDSVTWKGRPLSPVRRLVYFALNKPARTLCANSDSRGRPLAGDLLKGAVSTRLFHVGRLDYLSTGLVFYTNDGEFSRIVTHPSSGVRKEYVVDTVQPLADEQLERFRHGVRSEKGLYRLVDWKRLDSRRFVLALDEGRNREIREVMRLFGVQVRKVHRTRIGPVSVKGLAAGQFRHLSQREVAWFLQLESRRP